MSTHIQPPLLTNTDLESMPDDGNRYELIEGELYVSTAPDLLHQRTVGKIHMPSPNILRNNPLGNPDGSGCNS